MPDAFDKILCESRLILELAFPYDNNFPIHLTELAEVAVITSHITIELLIPVFRI